MSNLLVFALIGLLTGAAARLLYPGRQPTRILATMALGMAGAVVGGMSSWTSWSFAEDQFHTGNLLMSGLGAMLAIGLWAVVAYAREVSGRGKSTS